MRTTLTLDDDVAASLERLRKARRASLKEIVNEGLRRGLEQMTAKPKRRDRYRTASVDLGQCRVGSLDNVFEALAAAEGESFR